MMFKKIVSLFLVMLTTFGMTALGESVAVTDMCGREITLDAPATRIVALAAADCEILFALGCEDLLVGRGEYCNYPEAVAAIPAVQSGAETNLEEVLALEPQVLIMSDLPHTEEIMNLLEANGVTVVMTQDRDIEGVYYAINMIGTLVGKTAEAEAIVADMKAAFEEIAANSQAQGKTVYFEISPLELGLFTSGPGTFMNEIAEMCGLINAFADVDGWEAISEEQVLMRNPDYIVSVAGMPDAEAEIMGRAGWADVTAVANGDVLNADADAFSRPGPRLKDAAISLYNFVNGIEDAE